MKPQLNFSQALRLALGLLIASALAPAYAAPTAIANVPLMSIAGGSTVKPNIMLLYDDSGSMAWNHTPDYVDDGNTCRAYAKLSDGRRGCRAGDPPYNAPAFNRQYYNPQVRYLPAVKADLTSYPSQDRTTTNGWTAVKVDAYGIDKTDMRNVTDDNNSTNLVSGFPDIEWCDRNNSNCQRNLSGYTYPNGSYYNPRNVNTNPYYYTINVAEYCTNATLKTCVTTDVGAPAPANYPVPALVRWCSNTGLTTCQAKYVDTFVYPRFGSPNLSAAWYATIIIHDSGADDPVSITKVSAAGPSGSQDITNGVVTAAGGTNTAAERAALARLLAKSIVDKTGSTRTFTACMKTAGNGVRACTDYDFTLPTDEVVAVIPLTCSSRTNKNNCSVDTGTGRAGDQLSVESGTASTAILTVTGSSNTTTSNNSRSVIQQIALGTRNLFSSYLTLASNRSQAQVAASIVDKIGTNGAVKAYIGGSNVTLACQAANSSNKVCLVSAAGDAGSEIRVGTVTNRGSLVFAATDAVSDFVPTSVTGFDSGVFVRTDIVASRDSYPKTVTRTDCAGASCTYDEEMTNFANWYAYYKTRNQMMKTSVGHAFQPLDDAYKVGVVGLQTAAAEGTIRRPQAFTGESRDSWYEALYAMRSSGGTPVRAALHAIGKRFANRAPYNDLDSKENVVEFACQQNFTFVTTDGYWNGPTAAGVENNDNRENPARFCTIDKGCVDKREQTLPSLADVALYWYNGGANSGKASLRPDLEVGLTTGLVAGNGNTFLHMRTYALGLGVDGVMTYEPNYDTAPIAGGDFYNLKNQVQSGCPWNDNGAYVWPEAETWKTDLSTALQSRVDDLWHAAINGGGKYFAASDPQQVISGLSEALNAIRESTGAAAASATSTPNVTQIDRDVFSATFTTLRWTGNLTKRYLDIVTGEVEDTVQWRTSWTLGQKVGRDTDSREIWWRDPATGTRKEFLFDRLGTAEQAWFANKCGSMSQCAGLTAADRVIVNRGDTIVNWLRGQQQYANDAVLRARTTTVAGETGPAGAQLEVLGDIASSKPAYRSGLRKSYAGIEYQDFGRAIEGYTPTVFIAANDGMLHAFDAADGKEMWGYMPRITMKKLARQASLSYADEHQFTTDGSPELADVKIGDQWRTVLVAGLNAGGRGYYALDVTDPANPKPLWEICADPSVCSGSLLQPNMGLSFGNPMFGTIKRADGTQRWVVFLSSGYNNIPGVDNVSTGDGKGYLFVVDVGTGELVENGLYSTDSGSVSTPSGLSKITAISKNPETDPLATNVFAGDNLGQMWNFDFTGTTVKRILMANAGPGQPITTRPDVTMCSATADASGKLNDMRVAFGTGRMLDLTDIAPGSVQSTTIQSMYVLKVMEAGISATDWAAQTALSKRTLVETQVGDDNTVRSNVFGFADVPIDTTKRGWFFNFDKNAGERVNIDPKIVAGTLAIATNVPQSSTACTVGGLSYGYYVDVCTGEAVIGDVVGNLISNDAAAVGFIVVRLPTGALKMVTTTARGDTVTTEVKAAKSREPRRAGWRRVRE